MFYTGTALPEQYRGGAFIGQHGSWNRSELVGYRVAYVPFANGRPSGEVQDFLTGFLNAATKRKAAPSASPSIAPARCWLRMMSATSSGAWRTTSPPRQQ